MSKEKLNIVRKCLRVWLREERGRCYHKEEACSSPVFGVFLFSNALFLFLFSPLLSLTDFVLRCLRFSSAPCVYVSRPPSLSDVYFLFFFGFTSLFFSFCCFCGSLFYSFALSPPIDCISARLPSFSSCSVALHMPSRIVRPYGGGASQRSRR